MLNLEWIYMTTNNIKLIKTWCSRFCFNLQSNQSNRNTSNHIFIREKLIVVFIEQLLNFRFVKNTEKSQLNSSKETKIIKYNCKPFLD